MKDFDRFLDELPVNVGYNALIAAGMAWVIAGVAVLFTSMEVDKVSHLRADMLKVEALQPPIPVLKYSPVSKLDIENLGKKIEETYAGIHIVVSGEGGAIISATDTDYFPQFMAAVNTFENGARNWKVDIASFCVGRDCVGSKLSASLTIKSVRVDDPPAQTDEPAEAK